MGEFADMIIDQMYDPHWGDYPEDNERPISYKTCSICKEPDLIWGGRDDNGKWFLTDIKYNRHVCKKLEPDPLDDINNRKVRVK